MLNKLIAQNENVRSFLFKNCEHINTISLEKRKKVKATILDQDLLAEYHILHLLAIPYRAFPNRETLAAWLKDLQADLVKGNITRSNRLYTQVMELQKIAVDLLNSPDNFVFKISKETFDKYWSVLEAFRRKSIFKAPQPKPKNKGLNGVEETEDNAVDSTDGLLGVEDQDYFTPEFKQFKNKGKQAILHLKKEQKGVCKDVFYREDVGYIDLVWGYNDKNNKGFGLKHIIDKHEKEINQLGFNLEDFLPIVVNCGIFQKTKDSKKVTLEGETFRVVIGVRNSGTNYVLSAFDLRPLKLKRGLNGINESVDGIDISSIPLYYNQEAQYKDTINTDKSKNRFGLVKANSKVEVAEGYLLPGEVGKFLGTINPYKYAIVLTGDPHAGKTEFLMQMLDAFLSNGQKVALLSVEQGGIEAKITKAAIDRNISEDNQDKLLVAGEAPSFEDLKELGKEMDVVAIDSWQKIGMPNTRFDELRLECPNTIWVTIFQQNGEGGTRGGVSADYDSPVILKVHKVDKTFVNNYVELKKNRGNSLNRHYMVATKVCNEGFEPEKVEELE